MLNFINLSTAQAMQKGKEVAVRTILGSSRFNIAFQFIMETLILVLAATLLSLVIIHLVFPNYQLLTEKNYTLADLMGNFGVMGCLISIIIITGLLASIYPSLYLSRINPLVALKMSARKGRDSHLIRKCLVTLQFSIALLMIISTIVIYKQLHLINEGSLAINRNHIISIRTRMMGSREQAENYRQEILRDSKIIHASLGMHLPRQADFGRIDTKFMVKELGKNDLFWNKFQCDGFFPRTFDLDFVAGHDFINDVDSSSIIINEAAARSLGITPAEAIGLFLEEDSINTTYTHITGNVIGVVKDFPYTTIKNSVAPLLMISNVGTEGVLSVKLTEDNITDKIRYLENKWKQIFPTRPFEYWFLDDQFDRLYFQERRLGKLVPVFTGLTVIIALMGLFALTIFMAEQRNKEIGIRKVLGSTTVQIIKLLSWDFMQLVLFSMLIGTPVAILMMRNWLDNFAYKARISVWDILFTVTFISLVSLITISFKAVKSARSNPSKSLRSE
jgi:putative ABC transport system permease protein